MRLLTSLVVVSIALQASVAQDAPAPPAAGAATQKPTTVKDKVSYAIGMNIGRQLTSGGMELNPKMIAQGIATIFDGTDPVISEEEIAAARAEFQKLMTEQADKAAGQNQVSAENFLKANGAKDGVKTTKSGLQYVVLAPGAGASPTRESRVSTHYRGKLIDGKVFDESYKGKSPTAADKTVSFGVTQVIAGWTEALQLMKPGAKYRLFIPPALAYGERGPGSIGPNQLLIFDLELVSFE